MKVLLLAHGTSGDVLPYVWLGRVLQQHGHEAVLIANGVFERHAEKAGLAFIPLEDADFEVHLQNPGRFQAWEGTRLAYEFAGRSAGAYAAAVESWTLRHGRPSLMMASPILYGAHLAREKLGIPLITVHLSPLSIQSIHAPALFTPEMRWLKLLPYQIRKFILSRPNPFEPAARPWVKKWCAEHGVPMPEHLSRTWWDSPDGSLALFPKWFAPVQPDWPPDLLTWEFPLQDPPEEEALPGSLLSFLSAGEKPVIFTAGTFNPYASHFFQVAAEATKELKCRAILVGDEVNRLQECASPEILTIGFAPFGPLLRKAAALVHHGGIGTLSQAFSAGIPQIIIPLVNDQYDNAARLKRLGAGNVLARRALSTQRLAKTLANLLSDRAVKDSAVRCAEDTCQRLDPLVLVRWLETRGLPNSLPAQ